MRSQRRVVVRRHNSFLLVGIPTTAGSDEYRSLTIGIKTCYSFCLASASLYLLKKVLFGNSSKYRRVA